MAKRAHGVGTFYRPLLTPFVPHVITRTTIDLLDKIDLESLKFKIPSVVICTLSLSLSLSLFLFFFFLQSRVINRPRVPPPLRARMQRLTSLPSG